MSPALEIIAHRGASAVVGEDNTIKAFEAAIALGASYIETDVHMTADDKLICFHDNTFDDKPITQWTFVDLQAQARHEIPLLEAYIQLCCQAKIGMDIEIKNAGYEAEILELLNNYNVQEQCIIKSFNKDVLSQLRSLDCPHPIGLLIGGCDENIDAFLTQQAEFIQAHDVNFSSPAQSLLSDHYFSNATLAEIPCYVWTVNSIDDMQRCLSYPIQGIITDRVDHAAMFTRRAIRQHSSDDISFACQHFDDQNLIRYLTHCEKQTEADTTTSARVSTRCVDLNCNSEKDLVAWINSIWPNEQDSLCLVFDASMGQDIVKVYTDALNERNVLHLPLEGDTDHLSPYAHISEQIQTTAKDCAGIISLGSGTVNDLCKYSAHALNIPYLSIATAASMNGYTSAIAALLKDDLKSTLACTPPIAVLSNSQLIQSAPLRLSQSGYADLLSKFVSVSDWQLSSLIRDDYFDELPGLIASTAIDNCIQVADRIRAQERAACNTLMRAIILSGYSMALAGSSAPASGGEHLISHYLDMTAYSNKGEPELHGLQVGLGTLLTSSLYELLQDMDPQSFKPRIYSINELEAAHSDLWPIIKEEACAQIPDEEAATTRLTLIQDKWHVIWQQLHTHLKSSDEIRSALSNAGIACNPEAYGIERSLMKKALCFASDIRDRYTVLHFARDCGVLESIADQVIERAFGSLD